MFTNGSDDVVCRAHIARPHLQLQSRSQPAYARLLMNRPVRDDDDNDDDDDDDDDGDDDDDAWL
eukprot:1160185-Pelagomonas_calceolata.AAC.14